MCVCMGVGNGLDFLFFFFFFYDLFFSFLPPLDIAISFLIFFRLVSFCLWVHTPPPHCYTICYDSPKFMDPPMR
ncbi:hypothetical protein HETIRDRAFT_440397, partial [Heterobasidion irregulare TC 32-1]